MQTTDEPSAAAQASGMADSQRAGRRRMSQAATFLERYGIFVVLVITFVAAWSLSPAFRSKENLFNILRESVALGVASVGQTFVILGAGIDLSIGAVMGLAVVLVADVSNGSNQQLPIAVAVTMGVAMLVGLLNGFLVTKRNVPPIVATLGVLIFVEGARLAYTLGTPSGSVPPAVRYLGTGYLGPLPVALLVFALVAGIGAFVLRKTRYGRRLYATGGNRDAAYLSGISVDRILMITYIISALLAALAGMVEGGYIGYVDRYLGRGFELDSIAAVIVGGAAFTGGRGGILGTVAGVLFLTILLNIVVILNLNVQLQLVIKGVAIVGAVALYSALRRGS